MHKAPPPDVVARYVRWALLAFFAYALWSGMLQLFPNTAHTLPGSASHTPSHAAAADKDCGAKHNPFEDFSLIASTLIPTTFPVIRTQDITTGTGAAAACGQHATLRYQYALQNGSVIFSNLKSSALTHAVIGGNTLLHGLELGILGMKPGGERKVAFPSVFAFDRIQGPGKLQDTDKFALRFEDVRKSVILGQISLTQLSPDLPSSPIPLRITERRASNGVRVQCGDTVRTRMTIWKLDGTKFFSTDDRATPLVFTLGESQMPFGIEQGILGMPEGSQRTILLPAAYTRPLVSADEGAADSTLVGKLPEEIMFVEVSLEHIGEEAKPAAKPMPKPTEDKKPDASGDKDPDKAGDSEDK